jgi:CheY-like chemotaxis protein
MLMMSRCRQRETTMQNILVIDDEPDVRDAVKRVLDRAGYSVRTVDNATDALVELKRVATDVVITDIIMPKIDGVQAIESIRKAFPSVRIIAISGGGNFGISTYQPTAITTTAYLASAEVAGAHLALTKPFESGDLIQAVEKVLGVGHA